MSLLDRLGRPTLGQYARERRSFQKRPAEARLDRKRWSEETFRGIFLKIVLKDLKDVGFTRVLSVDDLLSKRRSCLLAMHHLVACIDPSVPRIEPLPSTGVEAGEGGAGGEGSVGEEGGEAGDGEDSRVERGKDKGAGWTSSSIGTSTNSKTCIKPAAAAAKLGGAAAADAGTSKQELRVGGRKPPLDTGRRRADDTSAADAAARAPEQPAAAAGLCALVFISRYTYLQPRRLNLKTRAKAVNGCRR